MYNKLTKIIKLNVQHFMFIYLYQYKYQQILNLWNKIILWIIFILIIFKFYIIINRYINKYINKNIYKIKYYVNYYFPYFFFFWFFLNNWIIS